MVRTKGDVIVDAIKIGDIHYEFEYGTYIKTTVSKLPIRSDEGYWAWESTTDSGEVIEYGVSEDHSHYGPNVYTYMAYMGCKQLK